MPLTVFIIMRLRNVRSSWTCLSQMVSTTAAENFLNIEFLNDNFPAHQFFPANVYDDYHDNFSSKSCLTLIRNIQKAPLSPLPLSKV